MKKDPTPIMQSQSMLVSQRRAQDKNFKLLNKCDCKQSIKNIQNKLQFIELKLEELSSNVNISFNKHMEGYTKLIDQQKKIQNIQYTLWQHKQHISSFKQNLTIQLLKQQSNLQDTNQQIHSWSRMLRDFKTWKSNHTTFSTALQNKIYETFKNYKQDNDQNIKKIFITVQEIGFLQRKMLEKWEYGTVNNQEKKNRTTSYCEKLGMYGKRNATLENTAIYANRNIVK